MKKYSNEKGVTLIILAITIVVLSIIAGVVISFNYNDNAVKNIAEDKKEETEKMFILESIKLNLVENPPENYENLISYLNNYGKIENEDDENNAILITNQGNYEIYVKDIWNINKQNID